VLISIRSQRTARQRPGARDRSETTFPRKSARYVDEARAIARQPVLVTSLTRPQFHRRKAVPRSHRLRRGGEARGRGKKVPLVDLNARSIEQAERLGPAGFAEMEPERKNARLERSHAPQRARSRNSSRRSSSLNCARSRRISRSSSSESSARSARHGEGLTLRLSEDRDARCGFRLEGAGTQLDAHRSDREHTRNAAEHDPRKPAGA